jgi:hypothetical protein
VIGDAYERAFEAIKHHVYSCAACAWIGDPCAEREQLIDAMLSVRQRWYEYRRAVMSVARGGR